MGLSKKFMKYKCNIFLLHRVRIPHQLIQLQAAIKIQHWFYKRYSYRGMKKQASEPSENAKKQKTASKSQTKSIYGSKRVATHLQKQANANLEKKEQAKQVDTQPKTAQPQLKKAKSISTNAQKKAKKEEQATTDNLDQSKIQIKTSQEDTDTKGELLLTDLIVESSSDLNKTQTIKNITKRTIKSSQSMTTLNTQVAPAIKPKPVRQSSSN